MYHSKSSSNKLGLCYRFMWNTCKDGSLNALVNLATPPIPSRKSLFSNSKMAALFYTQVIHHNQL